METSWDSLGTSFIDHNRLILILKKLPGRMCVYDRELRINNKNVEFGRCRFCTSFSAKIAVRGQQRWRGELGGKALQSDDTIKANVERVDVTRHANEAFREM